MKLTAVLNFKLGEVGQVAHRKVNHFNSYIIS